MSKTIIYFCLSFACLLPSHVFGAISFTDGTWSTTFDCPAWEQGAALSCNGLGMYGGWTANGQKDQIAAAANNNGGDGGNGFRHWVGDGTNVNGGGIAIDFPAPQKEFWMRWYLRYEKGFKWSFLGYDKTLYIHTGDTYGGTDERTTDVIPSFQNDTYALVSQIGWEHDKYYQVISDHGWHKVQGGSEADGKFHCFEIYLKMDTDRTDGIGRLWIDGVLRTENTAVDWSGGSDIARAGWTTIAVGHNQNSPDNGRNMAVDYDDIAIYQTPPSNSDAHGNAFIGMLGDDGGGGNDNPPPPSSDAAMPFDLLFEDPIEDNDFSARGWYDFTTPNLTPTEFAPGSSHALEYHFPENATKPVNGSAMRRKFPESDAVYISYYVKYSQNWVGSQRNYHPHEIYLLTNKDDDWSGLAYTNLTAYVEQNDLLPRMAIQDSRNIDATQIEMDIVDQTENRGVAGCNGDSDGYGDGSCYSAEGEYRNGKHWSAASTRITPGTWHKVEAFFKLNRIVNNKGVADGVMQYWLDGQMLIDHHDVMFRTARHGDMKFNQFIIAPWIGDGSPIEQTFWIDRVVVGTESDSDSPTCSDGVQNGDETGVDCGGACQPCGNDTPTCTDGILNGDETGVDCGGSCQPCGNDTPTCTDGILNGDETGVDCGGACQPCDSDTPTCTDGILNGDETEVDCGGACEPCIDGDSQGDDNGDGSSGCFIGALD